MRYWNGKVSLFYSIFGGIFLVSRLVHHRRLYFPDVFLETCFDHIKKWKPGRKYKRCCWGKYVENRGKQRKLKRTSSILNRFFPIFPLFFVRNSSLPSLIMNIGVVVVAAVVVTPLKHWISIPQHKINNTFYEYFMLIRLWKKKKEEETIGIFSFIMANSGYQQWLHTKPPKSHTIDWSNLM